MKRRARRTAFANALLLAAGSSLVSSATKTLAAEFSWDGDGQLPVNGGNGLWDLSTPRWFDGANLVPWTNPNNDAFFGATGSIFVIPGPAVRNLTFGADYSLLNPSATPTVLTLNSTVLDTGPHRVDLHTSSVGSSGFTKAGSGMLVLYGASNVTGGWNIQAGTVALGSSSADIPNVNVNISAGATLDLGILGGAYNDSIGILTGAGDVRLQQQTGFGVATGSMLTVGTDGATGVWSGVISGTGGRFSKAGSGSFTIDSAQTYTGITQINGGSTSITSGALVLGSGGALSNESGVYFGTGSLNAATLLLNGSKTLGSLANGGSLSIVNMQSNNVTIGSDGKSTQFNGALAGSGRLIKVGSGEQAFATNPSTWSGGVTIQGGRFLAQLDSRLGAIPGALDPANITLDGGTIGNMAGAGFGINANRGITITSNNGGIEVAPQTTLTVNSPIVGSGRLSKTGSGTLANNLSTASANTYSGGASIKDGAVVFNNSGGTPLGTGSVELSTSNLVLSPTGAGAISLSFGNLSYGPGANLVVSRNAGTSLSANFGSITRLPGGTLVLVPGSGIAELGADAAPFTRVTGTGVATNVNGGTPATNGDIASPTIISTTSATNFTGEFVRWPSNSIGFRVGTYSTSTNIDTATANDVYNATTSQGITTTATVYSINVRSGITVTGGSLNFGPGSDPAAVILNGGTISTSTLAFGSRPGILYAGGTSAATVGTIASNITGTAGITKIGNANLRLNSPVSFSGGLTVAGGTLTLGASNILPAATILTLDGPGSAATTGARLALGGTQQTIASLSSSGMSGTVDLGAGGSLTVSGTSDSHYRGVITGNTGSTLIKQGVGVLTLGETLSTAGVPSTVNGYQRLFIRNAGVVAVSSGNSLPPALNPGMFPVLADTLRFDAGALRITSINDSALNSISTFSIASGTAQRGITLLAGGATIEVTNPLETALIQLDDVTSRNIITGTGDLTKTGPGFLRLGPGNSYTGETIVLEGNLQIPTDSALGSAATLRDDALQIANGAMIQSVGNGSLSVNRGITLLGDVGPVGGEAALINTSTSPFVINGMITGSGALRKVGAGSHSLQLNAFNDFGGEFTIEAGRVDLNTSSAAGLGMLIVDPRFPVTIGKSVAEEIDLLNDIQLLSGSGIEIDVGAGIGDIILRGNISGPSGFGKIGAGKLVLGGSTSSFLGNTYVLEGTVHMTEPDALGSTAGVTMIAPGAAVSFAGINYAALEPTLIAGVGSGAGAIVNLSGDAIYSGPVTLMADASIGVSAGSLKLTTINGRSNVTKVGAGALTVDRVHTAGLTVGQTSVKLSQKLTVGNPADTSRVGALTLEPSTTLDITNNALAIDYPPSEAEPFDTIRAQIISAFNGGAWNGTGITSSLLAAGSQYAIGYAEASALTTGIPDVFGTVDSTAVLLRYTRNGDANLDGLVNLQDFNRLAGNFGNPAAVWSQGDFNYDGLVNLQDFNRLAGNFGLSAGADGPTPADWAALATAVPEPSSMLLVGAGVLLMLRRRRRHDATGAQRRQQVHQEKLGEED